MTGSGGARPAPSLRTRPPPRCNPLRGFPHPPFEVAMFKEPATHPHSQPAVSQLLDALGQVLLGKRTQIEQVVAAMLAGGHVLIEDLPGTGKTTLAKGLALAIGAEFRRIQFTPDLLPADITGGSVYTPATGEFHLRQGPVFTQVLLADEINRATPRTQSALLEAMEERQVSVDGVAQPLPELFWVIATQNPVEFHGVFPLPEAQMDRFLVRISLGYPDEETERMLLRARRAGESSSPISAVLTPTQVLDLRRQVAAVHVDPVLDAYAVALVRATRNHPRLRLGASPRVSMALISLAQGLAFIAGRDHILPEEVQRAMEPVMAHRIFSAEAGGQAQMQGLLAEIRRSVPVPA